MPSTVSKWHPVPDLDSQFGSIRYSFEKDVAWVRMVGERTLVLRFSGVVALRFEQECPGFDFPPLPLPALNASATFPLLRVDESSWREQFSAVYDGISHFALVSSDHLLQILAKSEVEAQWEAASHAYFLGEEEPNQPTQRNASSRPPSGDSFTSETPSSLGPRG